MIAASTVLLIIDLVAGVGGLITGFLPFWSQLGIPGLVYQIATLVASAYIIIVSIGSLIAVHGSSKGAIIAWGILNIPCWLLPSIFMFCIREEDLKYKKIYVDDDKYEQYINSDDLPKNVRYLETANLIKEANDHQYAKRTDLTVIKISDELVRLENSAFSNCINLKQVIIPDTIQLIGSNCFFNCKSLKKIKYEGTKIQFRNVVRGSNWLLKAGTNIINCSDGTIGVDPLK